MLSHIVISLQIVGEFVWYDRFHYGNVPHEAKENRQTSLGQFAHFIPNTNQFQEGKIVIEYIHFLA